MFVNDDVLFVSDDVLFVNDDVLYYQQRRRCFFVKVSSGKILKYCFCVHTLVLFTNGDDLYC